MAGLRKSQTERDKKRQAHPVKERKQNNLEFLLISVRRVDRSCGRRVLPRTLSGDSAKRDTEVRVSGTDVLSISGDLRPRDYTVVAKSLRILLTELG
ncbi:hypothetical protein IGI04_012719 [Brassica rapa subsp. trilocularis]|uniref:Uncharacterized protein n=1 Tax=Brassica rapa subsp. trilocularis TaxID=1813537 RepID=A0ABQ7N943_BRACM|nr:hypothetical protein IGI04_012719 [Brassica rapa subsp. trilocularis]